MESLKEKMVNQPLLDSKELSPPPVEAGEQVSSELEDILSDASLSCWRRFRKAVLVELRTLYILAAPAVIVYLLNNIISMSTQIFCGHLGNLELAATSLGNNGVQLLAYGIMVGNSESFTTCTSFPLKFRYFYNYAIIAKLSSSFL